MAGAASLPGYGRSIVAATSDLGVEFGLPTIKPVAMKDVLPWLEPPPPAREPLASLQEDDDVPPTPVDEPEPEVSIHEVIPVFGVQHIFTMLATVSSRWSLF